MVNFMEKDIISGKPVLNMKVNSEMELDKELVNGYLLQEIHMKGHIAEIWKRDSVFTNGKMDLLTKGFFKKIYKVVKADLSTTKVKPEMETGKTVN